MNAAGSIWRRSESTLAKRPLEAKPYQDAIQNTANKNAPWYVIPADNKWFTRIVAALAIVTELNELNLAFPDVEKSKRKELEKVRESLEHEKD